MANSVPPPTQHVILLLLVSCRSIFQSALEELERITREWGMAVNYSKTEAVVFGLPAATTAATIQVGSNSVAVGPQFKYVGSIVQAGGGQDKVLQRRLCSAGQVFRSLKSVLLQEGGSGLQAQVLLLPGAAAVRCSRVMGPHRRTGGTTGDLPQAA